MNIRRGKKEDIPAILQVVEEARRSMADLGIDQWQDGYPDEAAFRQDIRDGVCYVGELEGMVCAVMALCFTPEPCYAEIKGRWLEEPECYGVIHRMATSDLCRGKGAAAQMLDFAEQTCLKHEVTDLRVDTHRGNLPMQKFLKKHGFLLCGQVLYEVKQGDPIRLGYEKLL